MTVGELGAAHLGLVVDAGDVVGVLVRVQHDSPTTDIYEQPVPARTLLVLDSWSGALDPTHPITIETGA